MNNPPPRRVMGYRFNIFYPLLNSSDKVPHYFLKTIENGNFCEITFLSSPPYLPLKFKIVNERWNMKDRRTFKCVYENTEL